VNKC
jgi:hypothetical protein